MTDLINKISDEREGEIERQDVINWFDNISNNIESAVYDTNNNSGVNQVKLFYDIEQISADLETTVNVFKMVELSYVEIEKDLKTMKIEMFDKAFGFDYDESIDKIESINTRLKSFIEKSRESYIRGDEIDFKEINNIFNNSEVGVSNNFYSNIRMGCEQMLVDDLKKISHHKELIDADADNLNIDRALLPSISRSKLNEKLDGLKNLKDDEVDALKEQGVLPIKDQLFDADELYKKDIESGATEAKSEFKRGFRFSLNNETMRAFWMRLGQEYVYDDPLRKAWGNLKDIFKEVFTSMMSKMDNTTVLYFERDSADKKSHYTQLKERDLIDISEQQFEDMVGKTSEQYEIIKKIRNQTEKYDSNSTSGIDTNMNKELRESKSAVMSYLNGYEKRNYLTSDDLESLKLNLAFIDAVEEIKRTGVNELDSNEVDTLRNTLCNLISSDKCEAKVKEIESDDKIIKSVRSVKLRM